MLHGTFGPQAVNSLSAYQYSVCYRIVELSDVVTTQHCESVPRIFIVQFPGTQQIVWQRNWPVQKYFEQSFFNSFTPYTEASGQNSDVSWLGFVPPAYITPPKEPCTCVNVVRTGLSNFMPFLFAPIKFDTSVCFFSSQEITSKNGRKNRHANVFYSP